MSKLKQSEHNVQASFVDSVLWQYRTDPTFIRPLFLAVPNGAFLGGGEKRFAVYGKLRKEGLSPGVSDILYLQSRGEWSFLSIEFKTEEKRRRSDLGLRVEQVEFITAAARGGGAPFICFSVDDAIEAFSWYMALEAHPGRALNLSLGDMLESLSALKSEESLP